MKNVFLGLALALGIATVAYAAGPIGEANIETLKKCGFTVVKESELVPGGGTRLKITKETIKKLEEMMKNGKGLHVADSGELTEVDTK